jgi:thymidylate synthase ThyX
MTDLYNTRLFLNAQEIIAISKVRLCSKAEKETREVWEQVIKELAKQEPILAGACVPSCIYRGLCPEMKSCKYNSSIAFRKDYNRYINNLIENNK